MGDLPVAHTGSSQRPERGLQMVTNFAAQTAAGVSAIILLVDFLIGITCGMFAGLAFGSVRENYKMSLLEQAPDPISAGARTLLRPFIRDDGYMRRLPPGRRGTTRDSSGNNSSGTQGREVNQ